MKLVEVCMAVGEHRTFIHVTKTLPRLSDPDVHRAIYGNEGCAIAEALFASLPNGTSKEVLNRLRQLVEAEEKRWENYR